MASFFEVAAVLDAGVLPGLANMSDDTNGTMQTSLALFAEMVAARSPDDPRSMNHPRSMRSVMIGNPQGGMTTFRMDKAAGDDEADKGKGAASASTVVSDLR